MRRRALLLASGAWLISAAASSFAQGSKPPRRIAFVHPGPETGWRSSLDAFRGALTALGTVDGRDVLIEAHWADDKTERLASIASEVVASKPVVIVTATSAGVAAFKKVTSSIPIVFATAFNPVEQGFVASLPHPGGNITGVIVYAGLTRKIVEIAREALPRARRFAMMIHDTDPAHRFALDSFESTAKSFHFEPTIVRVSGATDLDRAFSELARIRAEILFLPNLAFSTSHRVQLAERAARARLPLLSASSIVAESGGLLSYGTVGEENYRRAASLVDRILRGAKPGDLPVEQPERFQFIVNMKTAKAIGVKLSPTTMLRATKVIE